jgi:hypothetical protein
MVAYNRRLSSDSSASDRPNAKKHAAATNGSTPISVSASASALASGTTPPKRAVKRNRKKQHADSATSWNPTQTPPHLPPTTTTAPRPFDSRAAVTYDRRRSSKACTICRARKTRCDSQRPRCGFCTSTGGQCDYSEPETAR